MRPWTEVRDFFELAFCFKGCVTLVRRDGVIGRLKQQLLVGLYCREIMQDAATRRLLAVYSLKHMLLRDKH